MKPRMMSKQAMDHLFDHILNGFEGSFKGIENLEEQGLVAEEEIHELLKKNSKRLIERIKEFKLMQKLVCIFFAFLFGWMQITGDDHDMIRNGRSGRSSSRTARSARGTRSGRRNGDDVPIFDECDELPEYV